MAMRQIADRYLGMGTGLLCRLRTSSSVALTPLYVKPFAAKPHQQGVAAFAYNPQHGRRMVREMAAHHRFFTISCEGHITVKTKYFPPDFPARPRYLRAIPSLMLLTTAMAWGVAPDATDSDVLQKKARVALVQGPATTGAEGNAVVAQLLKDGKKAG